MRLISTSKNRLLHCSIAAFILMASCSSVSAETGNTAPDTTLPQTSKPTYRELLPKAEAGNPQVQTTLGLMRLNGDEVPRDLKIARIWLGKAATQNHIPAQYYLGQLLMLDAFNATPFELNQQLAEGLFWLRRAARAQHPQSQLLYARTIGESTHESPFGHSKNEAEQHLISCSETYLPCTRYALGQANRDDSSEQTKRLLYTLANVEDAQAMYSLDRFANEEEEEEEEEQDSLFWIRRAARLGHPQASYELADKVIHNQTLLQPDDPSVLALLSSAAEQNMPQAMHVLGSLLHEGTRFPVNKPLGLQWLNLAAQQGYQPSAALLEQLEEKSEQNQEDTP